MKEAENFVCLNIDLGVRVLVNDYPPWGCLALKFNRKVFSALVDRKIKVIPNRFF